MKVRTGPLRRSLRFVSPRAQLAALIVCLAVLVAAPAMAQTDAAQRGLDSDPRRPARADHTARQPRPIPLGTSGGNATDIGNGYCCSGTLGALVQDRSGVKYILSNAHVLAGDTVLGLDGRVARLGDPVTQAGLADTACRDDPADHVARLAAWADLTRQTPVDAALAEVMPDTIDAAGQPAVDPDGRVLGIGVLSSETAGAALGLPVKKSGRTSGVTVSRIEGVNATIGVRYADECGGGLLHRVFTGQVLVANRNGRFLDAGDSGALLVEDVDTRPRAVGLLYAGSTRIAVAHPIDDVLRYFQNPSVGPPLTLSIVGAASGEAAAAAEGPDPALVAGATIVQERYSDRLLRIPGAVGHAVSLSEQDAVTFGGPVIKVLVDAITPETRARAPERLDGVPVVLEEIGEILGLSRVACR